MSIEDELWPTEQLKLALKKIIEPTKLEPDPELAQGVVDVTTEGEAKEQLLDFCPEVKLIGFELRDERRGSSWGGTLARVLQNSDGDRRCIQYVHTFTRQRWFISIYWHAIPLLLLAFWGFLVISHLRGEDSFDIATLSILAIAGSFILAGIIPHLKDFRNKPEEIQLRFRGTTPLIAYGVAELFVIIELMLLNEDRFLGFEIQKDLLSGWEIRGQSLIIPTSAIILATIGIFLAAVWLRQPKVKGIESYHEMDYAPIFVWLKKTNPEWTFERACWDYMHYESACHDLASLEEKRCLSDDRKHVRLVIANTWHAFSLGKGSKKTPILGLILLAAGLLGFMILLLFEEIETSDLIDVLTFVILPEMILAGIYLFFQYPSDLMRDQDLREERYHFTAQKLAILWNLPKKEAQFKIRTKMQDPFSDDPDFFDSFRD